MDFKTRDELDDLKKAVSLLSRISKDCDKSQYNLYGKCKTCSNREVCRLAGDEK
jgi:hypothetical protein